MKINWSKDWKASVRPSKQRKYRYHAPLHVRRSFLGIHLSPELRKKHGTRTATVRKGDTVKILRGQYKKKTGKVNKVLMKNEKVYVEGIENVRKDGTKTFIPLPPSNLMITDLELNDKRRKIGPKKEIKKQEKK